MSNEDKYYNGQPLSLRTTADEEGYEDVMDMLEEYIHEGMVPACCTLGCRVEPDGICPCGNRSIFLVAGIM